MKNLSLYMHNLSTYDKCIFRSYSSKKKYFSRTTRKQYSFHRKFTQKNLPRYVYNLIYKQTLLRLHAWYRI